MAILTTYWGYFFILGLILLETTVSSAIHYWPRPETPTPRQMAGSARGWRRRRGRETTGSY